VSKLIAENKIFLEHLSIGPHIINETGTYNIEGLFERIELAIDKVKAKRVVLDSLDTLFASLDKQILRSEFKKLFTWLKEKKVTAIITAVLGDVFLTRMGLEELVADCVVELNNRVSNQITTRRLRILKYRGSHHAANEYPFIIDENKMTVFPIISQGLQQEASTERISSGNKNLDEMLGNKGFYKGSSILISGTAGTGKTSLTATFINSACQNKMSCLFCAFEEAPSQIIRNMKSIGIALDQHVEAKTLTFYYARPTLQNLELHFMAIKDIINQIKPSVIILDPITNLTTEGLVSDRDMLTRFIDFLKTKQITVILNAAITVGSIARNPSDEGILAMVDSWILIKDQELQNVQNHSLYVMKSRGMQHAKEARELVISDQGITLNPMIKPEKAFHIAPKRSALEEVIL
jgi:circadian clock protein KaiC